MKCRLQFDGGFEYLQTTASRQQQSVYILTWTEAFQQVTMVIIQIRVWGEPPHKTSIPDL